MQIPDATAWTRIRTLVARASAVALCLVVTDIAAQTFDLQGHRGARGLLPENTLAGFARALELGATTLEMDLGISRDGHVVVSHDSRLNPSITRDAHGNWLEAAGPAIHSLSLEQIRTYDVGRIRPDSKYARRFPEQRAVDGARIPTLEEILALAPRAGNAPVRLNVEIKSSPLEPHLTPPPETFARMVVDAVQSAGADGRVTIQSFDWRTLAHVRSLAPGIQTAYLSAQQSWLDNVQAGRPGISPWTAGVDVDDFEGSVPRLVKHAGGDIWSPFFREIDAARVDEAKALGLKIIVWTVNAESDMHEMIDLGVDGIITDFPDRLREIARKRRLNLSAAEKGR